MNESGRNETRRRVFKRALDNLILSWSHAPAEEIAAALEAKAKALREPPATEDPLNDPDGVL